MTFANLRTAFISGVLLLAPVAATLWVLNLLLGWIGVPAQGFFFFFLPDELRDHPVVSFGLSLVAVAFVVALVTLFGYLSRYVFASVLLAGLDRLMQRVPLVRTVYVTVKQIVETFSQQDKAVFQKVVLLEFPRKGIYAIGFITSTAGGEVQERTSERVINVFVPTTPNPTSGYLCMVPVADLVELDMTVPEGMKLIISGGAVVPPWTPGGRPAPAPGLADPAVAGK